MGFTLPTYTLEREGFAPQEYVDAYVYPTGGHQDFECRVRVPDPVAGPAPLQASQTLYVYASKADFEALRPPIAVDNLAYTSQADIAACISGHYPPDWVAPVVDGSSVRGLKEMVAFCLRAHPVYGAGIWD